MFGLFRFMRESKTTSRPHEKTLLVETITCASVDANPSPGERAQIVHFYTSGLLLSAAARALWKSEMIYTKPMEEIKEENDFGMSKALRSCLAHQFTSFGMNFEQSPVVPQFGLASNMTAALFWDQVKKGKLNDAILARVEVAASMYLALRECQSVTQFISVLHLVMRTEFKEAMSKTFFDGVLKYLDLDGVVEQATGQPEWLKLLRQAGDNWQIAISNPCANRIHKLLTMVVTLGVCDPINVNFGNLTMLSIEAQKEQVSALSMVDAAFKTLVFICESGYLAYATNSLMPFLFTHDKAVELDKEYLELMDLFEYAIPGNLEKHAEMSDSDFMHKLDKCIDETLKMFETLGPSVERRMIFSRLQTLRSKRTDYLQTRVTGGLRAAPYAIFVTGGSGLGKSDLTDILYKAAGAYNDIDVSASRVCTFNSDDKYMSNYKSYMTVLKFDDFSQTSSDFMQTAPTTMLVKVINNVRETAVMADLADKGKVSIEPKFVTVTSNVMTLDADVYSNCPASVLRRANVHIHPVVKPQFRKKDSSALDPRKVNDFYRNENGEVEQPMIPDLWDITIYECLVPEYKVEMAGNDNFVRKPQQAKFRVKQVDGKAMTGLSVFDVIRYINEDSQAHFSDQDNLLKRTESTAFECCKVCKMPRPQMCTCVKEQGALEHMYKYYTTMSLTEWRKRQVTSEVMTSWASLVDVPTKSFAGWLQRYYWQKKEDSVSFGHYLTYTLVHRNQETMFKIVKDFEQSNWCKLVSWLPESFMKNKYVFSMLQEARVTTLTQEIEKEFDDKWFSWKSWSTWLMRHGGTIGACYWYVPTLAPIWASAVLWCTGVSFFADMFALTGKKMCIYDTAKTTLMKDHADMPEVFKEIRDSNGKYIAGTVALVAGLYAAYKVWKNINISTEQGNLAPTSVEEIAQRDAEVNPWKEAKTTRPMGEVIYSDTEHCKQAIAKSTLYMRVEGLCCNAFLMDTNRVMAPGHIFREAKKKAKGEPLKVELVRQEIANFSATFSCIVDDTSMQRVAEHDLFVFDCPSTGSWKDMTRLLPEKYYESVEPFHMFYRNKEGVVRPLHGNAKVEKSITNGSQDSGLFGTSARYFAGWSYELSEPTFEGLCSAPMLVTSGKRPCLAGFHLGGKTAKTYGVAACVLKSEVRDAIKALVAKGVAVQAARATADHESYGIQHITSETIHPKSPVNFMEGEGNLLVLGQCPGRATPVSRVETSVISDDVHEITGVPNTWGPPKFKGPNGDQPWKPWHESLKYSSNPSAGVPPKLLKHAKEDYLDPLKYEINSKRDFYAKEIRKLNRVETVSGIQGKRFIDPMVASTSRGFPLGGTKEQDIVYLAPDDEHDCPRTLSDIHWKEYDDFIKKAEKLERGNLPFKACLKDEPTPIEKDKVRVFQAACMTLQLGVRQYFLPLARFLSLHPLKSECAVGINAHGPEMAQLFKHIKKHGKKRGYAGDYSKYDLRMPAQLIYAAFDVMISLAKMFPENYSEEDINVMRTLATEVACAYTAFNGDFLQFIGSNPSGQNLTAYINSIVNSLLHRCAFFDWCNWATKQRFAQWVSLITYGDDYAGSVSSRIGYSNVIFTNWCAKYDIVVTPPDKKSETVPYLDCDTMDFLKRRPRFEPKLNCEVGFLDEKSIWKSLHSNLRSKTESKESVAASCIGSALTEFFLHGEEVYSKRREQLAEVARRSDIAHAVVGLSKTFDERVDDWKEKYCM